jgi:hypothetical protein
MTIGLFLRKKQGFLEDFTLLDKNRQGHKLPSKDKKMHPIPKMCTCMRT